MSDNERRKELIREFDRYDQMHVQNIINQDNTLAQLSVGLLAILATLGIGILSSNKTLGMLVVALISLTIVQVILGYALSNSFFIFVKRKLNSNYQDNIDPITDGTNLSIAGKINDILNVTSYVTFFAGIVLFCVTLLMYLKGVK